MLRHLLVILAVSLVVTAQSQSGNAPAAPQTSSQAGPSCSEPQQKQFDFWIGEWELTWPAGATGQAGHGTNSIHRILNGCVVQENFSGGDSLSLRGTSLSTYDARSGKWKQTWVDNHGGYLDFS